MAAKARQYAVIMGDIVGSERAESVRAMHAAFNKAVAGANKRHAARIVSPLTITLGDEFQGLLHTLAGAWEIASGLRLKLLQENVSCRFVIGAASVETPINTERAWNMMGPGLAAAREKLNDKDAHNAYRFSLPGETLSEGLLDAVGESLTLVEAGWTETQLSYYAASLAGRTNAKVAVGLGISERGLYKVLRAAQADFHTRQAGVVRDALIELDGRLGLA
jgi:hypothetical protein